MEVQSNRYLVQGALLPTPDGLGAAKRARKVMHAFLNEVGRKWFDVEYLTTRAGHMHLVMACSTYWHERNHNASQSEVRLNQQLEDLTNALENLERVFENLEPASRAKLRDLMQLDGRNMAELLSIRRSELRYVRLQISKRGFVDVKVGRKRNHLVQFLVARLVEAYEQISDTRFPINPHKREAHFVSSVAAAVDPTITAQQCATAIKSMPPRPHGAIQKLPPL